MPLASKSTLIATGAFKLRFNRRFNSGGNGRACGHAILAAVQARRNDPAGVRSLATNREAFLRAWLLRVPAVVCVRTAELQESATES